MDGGSSELLMDGIVGRIQLPGAFLLLIGEEGDLCRFLLGEVSQRHADEPQGRVSVPKLGEELLAQAIDFR